MRRTYEQCLEEKSELWESIQRMKKEAYNNEDDKKYSDVFIKNFKYKKEHNGESLPEAVEYLKRFNKRKAELKKELLIQEVEHKLASHNVKYAMLEESKEAIIMVFRKYDGKKYGPKTKEKIKEEIIKATNGRFYCYISSDEHGIVLCRNDNNRIYSEDLEIYIGNRFFANNTVKAVTEDNLKFPDYRKEFVEDTRAAALELIEQHRKVQAKMKELIAEANKYKYMTVEGMKKLPYYRELSDNDIY